jgi:Mn-containing catalase
VPEFTSVYYNMSQGADTRGPWNEGDEWDFVPDPHPAVDGGDGLATEAKPEADVEVLQAMASRIASDPNADLRTGTDVGPGEAI